MFETPENRIKRLKMRSWRRGTKEMDMILGPFSDVSLVDMDQGMLALYENMLDENDQELYTWMSGQIAPFEEHAVIVQIVRDFHKI